MYSSLSEEAKDFLGKSLGIDLLTLNDTHHYHNP